jgi:NIMA (never in mitosis gene a)-related kinase
VVFKVRRKDNKNIYVLKQIDTTRMNAAQKQEATNEARIMAGLNSTHIVRYYESFV